MKKLTSMLLAATALAAGAFAQIKADALRFHLSTPAAVSGVVLAAGDYTVRTSDASGNAVLSIESDLTGARVLALANRIGASPNAADYNRVVLAREDGSYRVDKIWIGRDGFEVLSGQ